MVLVVVMMMVMVFAMMMKMMVVVVVLLMMMMVVVIVMMMVAAAVVVIIIINNIRILVFKKLSKMLYCRTPSINNLHIPSVCRESDRFEPTLSTTDCHHKL